MRTGRRTVASQRSGRTRADDVDMADAPRGIHLIPLSTSQGARPTLSMPAILDRPMRWVMTARHAIEPAGVTPRMACLHGRPSADVQITGARSPVSRPRRNLRRTPPPTHRAAATAPGVVTSVEVRTSMRRAAPRSSLRHGDDVPRPGLRHLDARDGTRYVRRAPRARDHPR